MAVVVCAMMIFYYLAVIQFHLYIIDIFLGVLIREALVYGIVFLSYPGGRAISVSLLATTFESGMVIVLLFTSCHYYSLIYPVHRQIKYAVFQDCLIEWK